jgi:3'-phosphoadenosine 5'-phosphosulfate sulfotransferase (PAPS reductase)/FAD synthetase
MNEMEFYIEDLKSKFAKIDPKKYILSYSGGKDSEFLRWFIKNILHDTDIEIVSVNTYMEFPEIIQNQISHADKILVPKMKPQDIMLKYGTPCFSKSQDDYINRYQNGCRSEPIMARINGDNVFGKDGVEYASSFNLNNTAKTLLLSNLLPKVSNKCCLYLKKKPIKEYMKSVGKFAILGVMGSESKQRKAQYTSCFQKTGNFTPLWDLTEELENKIIEYYHIEIPPIYKYVHQTGCIGCPYGIYKGDTLKELQLVSEARKRYTLKLFGESYKIRGLDLNYQTTIDDFL